jgi:hypothetical protein
MFTEVHRSTLDDLEIDFHSSGTSKPSEAFSRLRNSLSFLGKHYDNGDMGFVIKDEERTSNICMRVSRTYLTGKHSHIYPPFLNCKLSKIVKVHKAGPKLPLFLVLYSHFHEMDAIHTSWISAAGPPLIKCSVHEQRILLRLLRINAQRLPASLSPRRHSHEDQFHLSFLLPLESMAVKSRSVLSNDACAICSKPATAVCSACHAIHYCDKGMRIRIPDSRRVF